MKKVANQYFIWKLLPQYFSVICLVNSMICSDISKLLYVISRALRRVKFETILKYHEQYLCKISRTNHAIICLYYCPQKVCNFHVQLFQIKLKYHCSKPIKLQKFLMQQYSCWNGMKTCKGWPNFFKFQSASILAIRCSKRQKTISMPKYSLKYPNQTIMFTILLMRRQIFSFFKRQQIA